jgi:hypothetical protein
MQELFPTVLGLLVELGLPADRRIREALIR